MIVAEGHAGNCPSAFYAHGHLEEDCQQDPTSA